MRWRVKDLLGTHPVFPSRTYSFRREPNGLEISRLFFQVLANGGQIEVEFTCVFGAILVNFFVDRVFHNSISKSSSGEHTSGHW